MSEEMTPRMRRLYARRDAILKQLELVDLEIKDLQRATGIKPTRVLRQRPPQSRRQSSRNGVRT